jgi:hypothetical protein
MHRASRKESNPSIEPTPFGRGSCQTLAVSSRHASTMSIQEATAVTQENLARYRELLISKSDGELSALVKSTPDNAAGVAASIILAERFANTGTWRHMQLLLIGIIGTVAGIVAAWFAHLSYVQQLQSEQQVLPSAQTSASSAQMSASSSAPQMTSPAPQSKVPRM